MTAQPAGRASPQRCGCMYQACCKGAPPHIVSPFSSDLPCPRPEDMRWGLSSAVQRPEDGSGLWGLEALPADGVEQAHSGECQPHPALCGLSVSVEHFVLIWFCPAYLRVPSHRHLVSWWSSTPCGPSSGLPLRR